VHEGSSLLFEEREDGRSKEERVRGEREREKSFVILWLANVM